MNSKRKLFLIGCPGRLGGAATKIRDLLRLICTEFEITVVLTHISFTKDKQVVRFCESVGAKWITPGEIPRKIEGVALGICELNFFTSGLARKVRDSGLRLVWSNEMMWEFEGEASAVKEGLIDRVLFLSEVQQASFSELYKSTEQVIIRNHIIGSDFPFVERTNSVFTVGRLSRPDPLKYPINFPVFYEELDLPDARFRVQAWSEELRKIYAWHKFGPEWDLLPSNKVPACEFLQSLDIFVYPLGHNFVESWGRSSVEAMLTGAIPFLPTGHQFHNVLIDGESGFLFDSFDECREKVNKVYMDARYRRRIAKESARYARDVVCNDEVHKSMWRSALSF